MAISAAAFFSFELPSVESAPNSSNGNEEPVIPTVLFVHGRGQSDKSVDQVRAKFLRSFIGAQKKLWGLEIVPESALKFVWYADTIDPKLQRLPDSENCKFLAAAAFGASFRRELRESLIRVAQAAGLDDFGLSLLASDTYKYLTKPDVRCEADTRIQKALISAETEQNPIILVAHSMGGIVSFSAIDRSSTVYGAEHRPHVAHFITVGTQIGLPEVLQGLKGGMVKVPVPLPNLIHRWTNFLNDGDRLAFGTEGRFRASDKLREPVDLDIAALGSAHAIETYLGDRDVTETIVKAWCDAADPMPRACAKVFRAQDSSTEVQEQEDSGQYEMIAQALADFFLIPAPRVVVEDGFAIPTQLRGQSIYINRRQLRRYQDTISAELFFDTVLFSLAHEVAHIAQRRAKRSEYVPTTAQVEECGADILGAAAFVNVFPLVGATGSPMDRVLGVISLAAETGGLHSADQHPRAENRALCVARGLSAGLALIQLRQAGTGPEGGVDNVIRTLKRRDPAMLQSYEELLDWSMKTSHDIVNSTFTKFPALDDVYRIPILGPQEFSAIAIAAEKGPNELMAIELFSNESPIFSCGHENKNDRVSTSCTISSGPSERIAFVYYDNAATMLQYTLLSRNWQVVSERESEKEFVKSFAKEGARALIKLDRKTRRVTIKFHAAPTPQLMEKHEKSEGYLQGDRILPSISKSHFFFVRAAI